MEKINFFTPGPTRIHPQAKVAMAEQFYYHRSAEFKEVIREVEKGLKDLFQTQQAVLILTSSGTGAMEAAVANLFSPGDKVMTIEGGKFGERWTEIARAFGLDVISHKVTWGEAVDPKTVEDLLKKNPKVTALFVQACETSTGVDHPIQELCRVTKELGILIIVDAISAIGAMKLPMDDYGIDVLIGSSQKALWLPPGLAFMALSDRAWERARQSRLPKFYFDLQKERDSFKQNQTTYTPAVSLVIGLREVLRDIQKRGLDSFQEQHLRYSRAVQAGALSLGFTVFSKAPSVCVTPLIPPPKISNKGTAEEILRRMKGRGLILAGGQGDLKGRIIRISHMGFLEQTDIYFVLSELERTLVEMSSGTYEGKAMAAASKAMELGI